MIRAGVNLEFLSHMAAELVLGEHPANGRLEYAFGMALKLLLSGDLLESAWPARVMAIDLVLQFVSGEHDLFGIYDDDVIAHIEIGCISGLVLAHQHAGYVGGEPADGFAAGIDQIPLAGLLEILTAWNVCLHDANLQICRRENEREEYESGVGVVKPTSIGTVDQSPRSSLRVPLQTPAKRKAQG